MHFFFRSKLLVGTNPRSIKTIQGFHVIFNLVNVLILCQEHEMTKYQADAVKEARLQCHLKQLEKENNELRKHIFSLQGEVYGARLAAKYLDKELAGR